MKSMLRMDNTDNPVSPKSISFVGHKKHANLIPYQKDKFLSKFGGKHRASFYRFGVLWDLIFQICKFCIRFGIPIR